MKEGVATEGGQGSGQGRLIRGLPGVLLVVLVYGLIHATARLLASGNLGEDDPLDNVLAQTLEPGYLTSQLPLYDWATWLLQQGMGAGVHTFLLLKYGLLVTLAGLLYATARRLTGSAVWALVAVESMSLTYQIFWRVHEGFTHRMAAMALAMATIWGLFRILDRGRWQDYALFGLLAGLGLLSERTYAPLLLALMLACLLQPAARRRVYATPMLLALAIAALVISPYLGWLAAEPGRLAEFQASLSRQSPALSHATLQQALVAALTRPVLALAPFIFILPLVFPGMFRSIRRHAVVRPRIDVSPDPRQLLLHTLLIEAALLIVFGALLNRFVDYTAHSLLPMLLIAVLWLVDMARESNPGPLRIRRLMVLTLVLILVAFLGRAANMFVLDPVCQRCRWGIPYAELADELRARGFKGGTIITEEPEVAGNLRRFFPDDRFAVGVPTYAPPRGADLGQVVLLWSPYPGNDAIPASLRAMLPRASGARLPDPALIQAPWRHLWKPDGYRRSAWWFVLIDGVPAGPR